MMRALVLLVLLGIESIGAVSMSVWVRSVPYGSRSEAKEIVSIKHDLQSDRRNFLYEGGGLAADSVLDSIRFLTTKEVGPLVGTPMENPIEDVRRAGVDWMLVLDDRGGHGLPTTWLCGNQDTYCSHDNGVWWHRLLLRIPSWIPPAGNFIKIPSKEPAVFRGRPAGARTLQHSSVRLTLDAIDARTGTALVGSLVGETGTIGTIPYDGPFSQHRGFGIPARLLLRVPGRMDQVVLLTPQQGRPLRRTVRMATDTIPAGMAGLPGEDCRDDSTRCTPSLFVDTVEVTQARFASVMGSAPWKRCASFCSPEGPEMPAYFVTWHEAAQYCRRLGKRLPSASEFLYAARAGGPDPLVSSRSAGRPRSDLKDGHPHLAPVGTFPPNSWHLYDMWGSLWHWSADRAFSRGLRDTSWLRSDDPYGRYALIRGAGWNTWAMDWGPDNDKRLLAETRSYEVGFRCAYP